jgi:hypothetical protein
VIPKALAIGEVRGATIRSSGWSLTLWLQQESVRKRLIERLERELEQLAEEGEAP